MFTVRQIVPADMPFLWDMAWEAIAVDAGMRALGREAALALPVNKKYLEGWGRPGDAGVIAVAEDGRRLGATWYRLFPEEDPGYGFVSPDVPELGIGVEERARAQGYRAVSLSVDRRNPARRLYERTGFHDAGVSPEADTGLTMIAVTS